MLAWRHPFKSNLLLGCLERSCKLLLRTRISWSNELREVCLLETRSYSIRYSVLTRKEAIEVASVVGLVKLRSFANVNTSS